MSDSQCARRYTRDRAITAVNSTARTSHFQRLGPGWASTRTRPTAVTAVAIACPDGKAAPEVSMRLPGGRAGRRRP